MDRFLLIEWMDAVASCWTKQDHLTQQFMDRWWWELLEALKFECIEFCPMMWTKTVNTMKDKVIPNSSKGK